MQSLRILCSMRQQFRAWLLDSWQFMTPTIQQIHQLKTSTRSTLGSEWSRWDYLFCNSCLDFSRKYFSKNHRENNRRSNQDENNICLYILQRFLVCLCCDKATQGCRGAMVPVHASIGLATFMLAIGCCISGLTQKAIWTLGYLL